MTRILVSGEHNAGEDDKTEGLSPSRSSPVQNPYTYPEDGVITRIVQKKCTCKKPDDYFGDRCVRCGGAL